MEPHPPYNTFPGKGIGCWNGDCVIPRLTTNPTLGVPPQSPDLEKTTDIWQGGLWWNHVKKETFWEGYFGMGGKATTMKDMVGLKAAITASGVLLHTADGGRTWRNISPVGSSLMGLDAVHGWACGGRGGGYETQMMIVRRKAE